MKTFYRIEFGRLLCPVLEFRVRSRSEFGTWSRSLHRRCLYVQYFMRGRELVMGCNGEVSSAASMRTAQLVKQDGRVQ